MIVGLIAIVALLVIRWPAPAAAPVLPETVRLPDGMTAEAVTMGRDWIGVVTAGGREIVIIDGTTGEVRQRIAIEDAP